MGNHQRAIKKLINGSGNLSYDEVASLLIWLGYQPSNKGKTSGSRVMFLKGNQAIRLHRPHPRKNLLPYHIKELRQALKGEL